MLERIVIIVFLILCFGQVWALFRGRQTAVIYYICVATLQFFSVWMFVTLDTARVCGALLVLGGFILYRWRPEGIPKGGYRLSFFFAYIVVVTLIGSLYWPIGAMSGRSAAYGPLRAFIQIVNWAIIVGTAWQIALALTEKGAFDKVRRAFVAIGMAHGIYALYQLFAYWNHLPLTGIRRAASNISMTMYSQQFAIATIGGFPLYRVNSVVGEPRSLAAASMLWITALLTFYYGRRTSGLTHLALLLSLFVLFLTFSTSGWGTFFFCLALVLLLGYRQRKSSMVGLFVVLLFLGIMLAVDSMGGLPKEISLNEVFQTRWTQRMEYVFHDLPIKKTLQVLSNNPQFFTFGTGAGGMSFYIAKNLGGHEVILAATIGWVNYLGDIGLIGILLMIFATWGGIRSLLFRGAQCDDVSRYMSFMGCVFLCATMISAPSYMLSSAFGFLLASEFRSKAMARSLIDIGKDPQRTIIGEKPCV